MADPSDMSWWFGGANPQNTQYQDRDRILQLINQGYAPGGITQQQAPQLQLGADPFRAAQLQQLGQLQGIASGQQQGAGELAAQRQYQNALAAQQAGARMARGGGAGPQAYLNAANQSAALGSSAAGMGQQAALQDQMNAQGLLGQVGAQGRQGDFSTANANAGYQMGTNQLNSQNYQQLLGQLGNMGANQLQAYGQAGQNKGMLGPLLSAGGQIGGAAIMASDARLKDDITDAREDIDAMLDGLRPVGWRYKDPKHGEGRWSGIIAQDMERSAAGRQIVRDEPDGKMLDTKKALSATLAASARLNERLRALEQRAPDGASLPMARVVVR
jgi:Chaperone of endosialidase